MRDHDRAHAPPPLQVLGHRNTCPRGRADVILQHTRGALCWGAALSANQDNVSAPEDCSCIVAWVWHGREDHPGVLLHVVALTSLRVEAAKDINKLSEADAGSAHVREAAARERRPRVGGGAVTPNLADSTLWVAYVRMTSSWLRGKKQEKSKEKSFQGKMKRKSTRGGEEGDGEKQ